MDLEATRFSIYLPIPVSQAIIILEISYSKHGIPDKTFVGYNEYFRGLEKYEMLKEQASCEHNMVQHQPYLILHALAPLKEYTDRSILIM